MFPLKCILRVPMHLSFFTAKRANINKIQSIKSTAVAHTWLKSTSRDPLITTGRFRKGLNSSRQESFSKTEMDTLNAPRPNRRTVL